MSSATKEAPAKAGTSYFLVSLKERPDTEHKRAPLLDKPRIFEAIDRYEAQQKFLAYYGIRSTPHEVVVEESDGEAWLKQETEWQRGQLTMPVAGKR